MGSTPTTSTIPMPFDHLHDKDAAAWPPALETRITGSLLTPNVTARTNVGKARMLASIAGSAKSSPADLLQRGTPNSAAVF